MLPSWSARSTSWVAAQESVLAYGKAFGIAAGAGGIAEAIKTTAEYETRLVDIQKKLGGTRAQVDALGQSARNLADSGKLAVPLDEILSAYERGAAAGLPLDDLKQFATLFGQGR